MTVPLTICIPAYNEEAFIARTIEQVQNQTFADFRLHVIDNCSIDGTLAVLDTLAARDPRITIHANTTNVGAIQNFQRCYWHADTEFVMLKSANDAIAPTYIEALMSVLRTDSNVALAYTQVDNPTALEENALHTTDNDPIERFAHVLQHFLSGHVLYGITRRSALDWASPIRYCLGTDHICVAEAALYGHITRVDQPLYFRTQNHGRTDRGNARLCSDYASRLIEEPIPFGSELGVIPPTLGLFNGYFEMIDRARVPNAAKQKMRTVCADILRTRFANAITQEVNELLDHTNRFLNHVKTNGLRMDEQWHVVALSKAFWIAAIAAPAWRPTINKVLQPISVLAVLEVSR